MGHLFAQSSLGSCFPSIHVTVLSCQVTNRSLQLWGPATAPDVSRPWYYLNEPDWRHTKCKSSESPKLTQLLSGKPWKVRQHGTWSVFAGNPEVDTGSYEGETEAMCEIS